MLNGALRSLKAAIWPFVMSAVISVALLQVAARGGDPAPGGLQEAIFAAGCFWCVEKDFDQVDGVVETISGYTGGRTPNPTYETVGTGRTGHVEALLVRFDPKRVTYDALLDHYWKNVDLLDGGGQFCDRGNEYRPVIFTSGPEQERAARASKDALEASGRFNQKIAVTIEPASAFTPAEEYHQNYYKKNPTRYRFYRNGCGRDARLNQLWPERTSQ